MNKLIKTLFFVVPFLGLTLVHQTSGAQSLFGEFQRLPDEIEHGFYVGGDFGMIFLTGTKRTALNPGFQLSITTGYDLFKYMSIEGIYTVGVHEADPNDQVLEGGVNTFLFNLAARGHYPLGRFYPFFEVGPGIHISRPDFSITGDNNRLAILIGGGMEYYTYLRHYSLYVKATYTMIDLPIDTFTMSAGLKYTF